MTLSPRLPNRHRAAFTLVELSVVLAIVGLLVGGVLITQTYIRSSQLNSSITEVKTQLRAFSLFESQYGGALPGDMGNASNYWSGAFNGNGNGSIDSTDESFYAYQQLSFAKLLGGRYSGSGPNAQIGTNVPVTSLEGVSTYFSTITGTPGYAMANVSPNHTLLMGRVLSIGMPNNGFLTSQEAYEIDVKYDNGRPGNGWVRAPAGSCTTDTFPTSADYDTANTAIDLCRLIFSRQ